MAWITDFIVGNGTLGEEQTIMVGVNDSTCTHDITYTCGTKMGFIKFLVPESSFVNWTPPLELAEKNTTGTSVAVTIKMDTYSEGNYVGTVEHTIVCTIPDNVKPTIELSVEDATGLVETYGAYVQKHSKLNVVANGVGEYGATIRSYKLEFDGVTYNTNSFTTDVLRNAGVFTIIATVVDSRGRTASASVDIEVLEYSLPKITEFNIYRCDTNGNPNDEGEYLEIEFTASVTPLNNKNIAKYTIEYKKSTDTTYFSVPLDAFEGQYEVEPTPGTAITLAADVKSAYNFILTVTDAFHSSQLSADGESGVTLWSIHKEHNGIAFGKTAEEDGLLDVAWKMRARDDVQIDGGLIIGGNTAEAVVSSANESAAGHIRFASGLVMQWGSTIITPVANTPTAAAIEFPIKFANIPFVLTNCTTSGPGTTVLGHSAANITTNGCNLYLTRTTVVDTSVRWFAIGFA